MGATTACLTLTVYTSKLPWQLLCSVYSSYSGSMPHLGKKAREQRLHRAAEIFGLVRNALPRETWNDERCGAVAAKLWCLGYLSVEDLRSYLFANNLLTEPEKILLAELANPQHDAVTTYSLPKGFEQYLSYPCPCRPVDFLQFSCRSPPAARTSRP